MKQHFDKFIHYVLTVIVCLGAFASSAQTRWVAIDSSQYAQNYKVLVINDNYYNAFDNAGVITVRKKDATFNYFSTIATDATLGLGAIDYEFIELNGMPAIVGLNVNNGIFVHRYDGSSFIQVGTIGVFPGIETGFKCVVDPLTNDIYLASLFYDTGSTDINIYRFDGTAWSSVVNNLNPTGFFCAQPAVYIKENKLYLVTRENDEDPTSLVVVYSDLQTMSNSSFFNHPVSGHLTTATNFHLSADANEHAYIAVTNYNINNGIGVSRLTDVGSEDVSFLAIDNYGGIPELSVKNGQVILYYEEAQMDETIILRAKRFEAPNWINVGTNDVIQTNYVYNLTSNQSLHHAVSGYMRDIFGYSWGFMALSNQLPFVVEVEVAPLCAGSQNVRLFESLKIQDLDLDQTQITAIESSDYGVISASTNLIFQSISDYDPTEAIRGFDVIASAIGNPGTAELTLYLTDGFEQSEVHITVTVHEPPTISLPFSEFEACSNGDLVDLNEFSFPYTGDFYYLNEHLPNGLFDPSSYTVAPINTVEFVYTDVNGCQATHGLTPIIFEPSEISVTTSPTACATADGEATLTIIEGAAPYDIHWSTGDRDVSTVSGLNSGAYFVHVTDNNNCLSSATAFIQSIETSIIETITNVDCFGGNTGAISLDINGPDAPYEIIWSSGHSAAQISNLTAGVYDVWLRGASGCETSKSFTVNSPEQLRIDSWMETPPSCGDNDGALTPNVTGGTGTTYTYLWSNGQTSPSATGLEAGLYDLTVTDQNNCQKTFEYTLNNLNPNPISASVIQPACGAANGSVKIIPENIYNVESVLWSNAAQGFNNVNLPSGEISCELTDWSGCKTFRKWNLVGQQPERNEICLLTVDSATTTNVLVWEKVQQTGISHYNIYRESSVAGQYVKISSVDAEDISVFNDVIASPLHRSWRYKISAVNACGVEGPLSRQHKTMHLVTKQLPSNEVRVSWDEYEGIEYGVFKLYRYTTENGWQLLETLDLDVTEFIDTPPTTSELDYLIEIVPDETCTGARAQDYNSSRSNKANGIFNPGGGTGDPNNSIEELEQFGYTVYPNPSAGEFTIIEASDLPVQVLVYNSTGQLILEIDFVSQTIIDLTSFDQGVYYMQLMNGTKVTHGKLILSK